MILNKLLLKNVGILTFIKFFNKFIGFVTTIFLISVLKPEDFGLVAAASILLVIFQNFDEMGISSAILQRGKNNIDSLMLSTGFFIKIFLSLVVSVTLFFIAPFWSELYDDSRLTFIVRIMSLTYLLSSIQFISYTVLKSNVNFKAIGISEFIEVLVRSLTAIYLAMNGFSYLSIVYGLLLGRVSKVAFLIYKSPFSIKLKFDSNTGKELFGFGRWLFLSGVFFSFYSVIDNAIVGNIAGLTALGLYSVAFRWGNLTSDFLRPLFQQVMLPIYSNNKHDLSKIADSFVKNLMLISLFSTPTSILIVVMSESILAIIGGSEWSGAVIPLQILAISGFLRSFHISGPIFTALGKPWVDTFTIVLQLVLLTTFVYFFTYSHGIVGASFGVLLTYTISTPVLFFITKTNIPIDTVNIIKQIFPFLLSGIIMYFSTTFIVEKLDNESNLLPTIQAIISLSTGLLIYIISLAMINKGNIKNIVEEFQ